MNRPTFIGLPDATHKQQGTTGGCIIAVQDQHQNWWRALRLNFKNGRLTLLDEIQGTVSGIPLQPLTQNEREQLHIIQGDLK